jgi:hypothetical protein
MMYNIVGIFKMKTACSAQILISIYHIMQNYKLEGHNSMSGWYSGQGQAEDRHSSFLWNSE